MAVVETLISKGVGWNDSGTYYWDVYLSDIQGQPTLYGGKCYSLKDAEDRCSRYYAQAAREIADGKW